MEDELIKKTREILKTGTYEFIVAIDDSDTDNMSYDLSEGYNGTDYKRVIDQEYEGNRIIIYAKKI